MSAGLIALAIICGTVLLAGLIGVAQTWASKQREIHVHVNRKVHVVPGTKAGHQYLSKIKEAAFIDQTDKGREIAEALKAYQEAGGKV